MQPDLAAASTYLLGRNLKVVLSSWKTFVILLPFKMQSLMLPYCFLYKFS